MCRLSLSSVSFWWFAGDSRVEQRIPADPMCIYAYVGVCVDSHCLPFPFGGLQETRLVEQRIPADPANPASRETVLAQAGQVNISMCVCIYIYIYIYINIYIGG